MNVLVNGIGNIGTTVLSLLCDYRNLLGIDKIYGLKNGLINPWNQPEITFLEKKGVLFCSRKNADLISVNQIIGSIQYIFDCNTNTIGNQNKEWYSNLPNLKGCSAQGSEKGFGTSYMAGINDEKIKQQKYVHIVSCNTHSIANIIDCLTNSNSDNLIDGDFVVVRRSEDIGQHERLVTANVVSRHMNEQFGTHHATDVNDLYATKNIHLNIQSSDVTTPSQLLHTVRFNLKLKTSINTKELNSYIVKNKFLSSTGKYDSNLIFELGRRYSPYGRIYSQAIINSNNLLLDEQSNSIKGWAFIPQEGSTILSTLKAFMIQSEIEDVESKFDLILNDLITKVW